MSPKHKRDLLGLALLLLTAFTALSLVPAALLGGQHGRFASGNLMGIVGAGLRAGSYWLLGIGVPLLPAFPALGGALCFGWVSRTTFWRWTSFAVGGVLVLGLGATLLTPEFAARPLFPAGAGGWAGSTLALPLAALLGWLGAALVVLFLAIVLPLVTIGWNPGASVGRWLGRWIHRAWSEWLARRAAAAAAAAAAATAAAADSRAGPAATDLSGHAGHPDEPGHAASAAALAALGVAMADPLPGALGPAHPPAVARGGAGAAGAAGAAGTASSHPREADGRRGARAGERRPEPALALEDPGDPTAADRPPSALLRDPPPRDAALSEREFDRLGQVLIETLRTFKVEGQIGGRTTGPVVTQFEVVPAPGVKVNRIAALDADLALALKAASVRIVAPIPGKGAVGVEVPNPEPEVVYLRDVLDSAAFQKHRGQLPLALGKDLHGRPYVADLARMPHLLIAGATGSGKSVCINTLITSLIFRHSPQTLRLLMIDPKMVELSMYADLPHLRHPVVTDPKDAATVLKWAVLEMERRYELLSENGARSLGEFNRRAEEGQPLRRPAPVAPGPDDDLDDDRWRYTDGPLPFLVVVVDELADLMLSVQAEIERPLAQLAQKARAIGIHLIVATQRPSVNVITGLIKANFPCRIAFRVSSKVDSRTILDQNGADALLGNGDMLFLPPGRSDPDRIQGVYLSTEETERLMAWYRERAGESRDRDLEEDILEVVRSQEAQADEDLPDDAFEERDPLFRQAAEVCIQFRQGSTSLLQRRLRIGYGRAARIIDQLHHAGILGPPDGSKPRDVLAGLDSLD